MARENGSDFHNLHLPGTVFGMPMDMNFENPSMHEWTQIAVGQVPAIEKHGSDCKWILVRLTTVSN